MSEFDVSITAESPGYQGVVWFYWKGMNDMQYFVYSGGGQPTESFSSEPNKWTYMEEKTLLRAGLWLASEKEAVPFPALSRQDELRCHLNFTTDLYACLADFGHVVYAPRCNCDITQLFNGWGHDPSCPEKKK